MTSPATARWNWCPRRRTSASAPTSTSILRPGWRAALEAAWTENTKRARYRYTWNFNPDGSEGVVFWTDKIHARHGFRWVHPVHEVLEYERPDYETVLAEGVQLDHRADPTKSRAQYLPLLGTLRARSAAG